MSRFAFVAIAVAIGSLTTPAPGRAYSLTEYEIPSGNRAYGITAGPDANLWFGEVDGGQIGKVTPAGTVTEYPIPSGNSAPGGITAGPDGNLWFTEFYAGQIGKVTPTGAFTEYPIPTADSFPADITAGPDGNLWFTERHQIGKVTPAGVFTEYPIPNGSGGAAITAGPDGNLWFVEFGGDTIAKVTPTGAFTEYPIGTASTSFAGGIAAGPDGNLWFTVSSADGTYGEIWSVTTTGTFTRNRIPTPRAHPAAITAGPDGNLWFVENGQEALTPAGTYGLGKMTPRGRSPSTRPPTRSSASSPSAPTAICGCRRPRPLGR